MFVGTPAQRRLPLLNRASSKQDQTRNLVESTEVDRSFCTISWLWPLRVPPSHRRPHDPLPKPLVAKRTQGSSMICEPVVTQCTSVALEQRQLHERVRQEVTSEQAANLWISSLRNSRGGLIVCPTTISCVVDEVIGKTYYC